MEFILFKRICVFLSWSLSFVKCRMLKVLGGDSSVLFFDFCKSFFLVFVIVLNPYGIKSSSDRHSEYLILGSTSESFDLDQDLSVVVLIDDETLSSIEAGYPVSYFTLAKMMQVISFYDPKLVFWDLLQHFEHSSNLDYWIRQLKKSGERHPVYMAQDPYYDTDLRLNDEGSLRGKLNDSTFLSPVSWYGPDNRYPLYISVEENKRPTTALLLYKEYCEDSIDCSSSSINKKNFERDMLVRWNSTSHSEQGSYISIPDSCKDTSSGFFKFLYSNFSYGFSSSVDREEKRNKCFPVLTIQAKDLLKDGAFASSFLRAALKDKYVFVGYDLKGSADKVISPVHRQLPGVFYHVMAFSNLVEMHDRYWKSSAAIGSYGASYSDIVQACLYFLVLIFSSFLRYTLTKKVLCESRVNMVYYVFSYVLFVFIVAVFGFVSSVLLDVLGPMNWLAYTGIVMVGGAVLYQPVFVKKVYGVLFLRKGGRNDL